MRGIEAQFLALQKGFNEIIPPHLLKSFDERELEVSFVTQFTLDCLWSHYWNIFNKKFLDGNILLTF